MCYHIGAEEVVAWALTADHLRRYILPVTVQQLAELVDQTMLPYRNDSFSEIPQQAAAVGQLAPALLSPWYDGSLSPDASHLIVVPDGRLSHLPFEILPLPDGQMLADHLVRMSYSLLSNVGVHPSTGRAQAFYGRSGAGVIDFDFKGLHYVRAH